MIITRTPYRISFMGGGTDYQPWYREHGGAVLTATIDKYCHVLLRRMPPFLGSKYRVFWSKMETVDRREDIEHPGVRGCLEYLGFDGGIEINHAGDLPARSGLGSSSAFTVGMLHALHALRGDDIDRARLAEQAIAVEQDVLGETVGIQDQIECAWGGLNRIEIGRDGTYGVHPVVIGQARLDEFQDWLVLVFTGLQRHASEIARAQVDRMAVNTPDLRSIAALVPLAVAALSEGRLIDFGRLLHETWMLKRNLSDRITTPEIDAIYDRARSAGAIGGKVLGAGGGGFMVFCVPPWRRVEMLHALGQLSVPVRFTGHGSEIVLR